MRANNILETIGNTPHVRINRLFPARVEVWMKLERANPGGSIKDRIGLAMIEDAERRGALRPGGAIIEPTSGNTGIALAMVAAVKGHPLILVMPESMSVERRRVMAAYGATFELTPRELGMTGAIERAHELVATTPGAWMPQQFEKIPDLPDRTRILTFCYDTGERYLSVDGLFTSGGQADATEVDRARRWPRGPQRDRLHRGQCTGGGPARHRAPSRAHCQRRRRPRLRADRGRGSDGARPLARRRRHGLPATPPAAH